ncbi:hypothetical protein BS17DRAFT_809588 [Gyrodon lividus]|nr:hypothetical protein BS17DRAFT_809588 [Gyrodon lividus]
MEAASGFKAVRHRVIFTYAMRQTKSQTYSGTTLSLMHKRKHRKPVPNDWEQPTHPSTENVDVPAVSDPCLYIQAHEADIIHGPQAVSAAHSLECPHASTTSGAKPGSGLLRWGAPPEGSLALDIDAESYDTHKLNQAPLWVDRCTPGSELFPLFTSITDPCLTNIPDRYDVRLLLESLPGHDAELPQVRPLSPSGWSDLPSDSEDTFFFSPDEVEDYRREKRRRLIDRSREDRLKALAAAEGEEGSDPWGGSDEEVLYHTLSKCFLSLLLTEVIQPDEAQRELICRTASHIISSPNAAQLEMRILANHGADKRFAFLRGRWSRAWRMEKERARQQKAEKEEAKEAKPTPLGGLVGYGDSDTGSEESVVEAGAEEVTDGSNLQLQQGGPGNEDRLKEARRERARKWAARRRAEQTSRSEKV